MNEQRLQAYYQLIQTLLDCPSGEEPEILAANTELLDADFVQVVGLAAEHFAQQGEENRANWLRNLATYLTTPETPPITEADIETYSPFILEVLRATAESNGNPEVIYLLLAANTDKLNRIFAELLRRWATNTLAEAEPDTATSIANVIGNFSNLIQQFPLGSKANNMEIAITGYEIIQTIYTRPAYPEKWATTQNNLATAYSDRILGNRGENLEEAIAAYSAALEVYTRTDFPVDWAGTQNNLAIAYRNRILGNRGENLEKAIAAYSAALEVYTRTDFPEKWATIQNNLATAYLYRILGNRGENLEKAIAVYSAALEVYTRTDFPEKWAMTQNNLAIAYSDRILGNRGENLEQAIAAYSAALEVYTRTDFPQKWAMTQNNLGNAYRNRILGNRGENLEQAIAAYSAALEVYTRTDFPQKWAMTQNNLGNAYRNRILGNRGENLEQAIAAYSAALEVYTRTDFPQNHAETLFNLGILYQEEKQFNLAYDTFAQAIATVEALRGEINAGDNLGEEGKRKQAEEWNKLYRRMIEVCLALGKDTEAIEYIERSKTRYLVELLSKADSINQKNLPDIDSKIRFAEIQNLLDDETVIIQWYIFTDCFRAFIITKNHQPIIWQSASENLDNLEEWTDNYLQIYGEDKQKWRYQLNEQLTKLTQILHLNEIISLISSQYKKLIVIPHRYLHLFPLHAVPLANKHSSQPEYLFDRFPHGVSYAPSNQLLRFTQRRLQKLANLELNPFSNLFAIQNPTNDLAFTDIEVETIAADFQPQQILKHHQATKAALTATPTNETLSNSQWLHFSCHGYFNFRSPLKSGLQLADAVTSNIPSTINSSRYLRIDNETAIDLDKCLTLEDIFQLNLNNCRLVCLSACETGFIDYTNSSDEYIGLASGFIRAGATNMISSLWAVSDFHTALLMIKFYENLPLYQYNVSLALNHTQTWLRRATQSQIIDWVQSKTNMQNTQQQKIIGFLQQYKPEQQPFKRPEFWAAFSAISPV
ncbi:TPR repeat protein [Trichormus variabilis ATCC 29413]|uniref:TPR repeat protein n=2 Tax=Anabaena variabilis TaxID=264691 RepID=Q3MFS0_TRIV2|nr:MULTISPECIES: CHAT domain-containing protein [Nostocaceae]ABA20166.1 TPR repeat protein [Trichormus variabilis ATCC 29413]MBC1304007.1 CHAT domain-containing protein [Trichormus variabilis N2B]MBC1314063.1 CHAT domain-containing protein [Trichormus variabilis PNB]QFZ14179.1 CHAT domain-containing protein [Anabaena sp. YBS01]